MPDSPDPPRLPLWFKLAYTVMAAVTVGVYLTIYPLRHFLWFSDVALILLVPALWLEHRLLASMMALGVLLPELIWNAGFLIGLARGHDPIGLVSYMFDPGRPLLQRALSGGFHILLPVVILVAMIRLGYDRRALPLQLALSWAILILSRLAATNDANINFVLGFGHTVPRTILPEPWHFIILLVGFPLLVHLPTHLVLRRCCGRHPTNPAGPADHATAPRFRQTDHARC
ncbi:MAG: membrane-associated protein [Planctomycetota bacterium]